MSEISENKDAEQEPIVPVKNVGKSLLVWLKVLSVLSIAASLSEVLKIFGTTAGVTVGAPVSLVTWILLIVLLRRFSGTEPIWKPMVWAMLGALAASFIAVAVFAVALNNFSSDNTYPALVIVYLIAAAGMVLYFVSAVRMTRITDGPLKLDILGRVLIFCILVAIVAGWCEMKLDLDETGQQVLKAIQGLLGVLPFVAIYMVAARAQRMLPVNKNEES